MTLAERYFLRQLAFYFDGLDTAGQLPGSSGSDSLGNYARQLLQEAVDTPIDDTATISNLEDRMAVLEELTNGVDSWPEEVPAWFRVLVSRVRAGEKAEEAIADYGWQLPADKELAAELLTEARSRGCSMLEVVRERIDGDVACGFAFDAGRLREEQRTIAHLLTETLTRAILEVKKTRRVAEDFGPAGTLLIALTNSLSR